MIIICGKTASGKSTVQKELAKLGMNKVVTYTTRPPRDGELDGEDYHFIDRDEFRELMNDGFFVETTAYHVATDEVWYYGTPLHEIQDADSDKVLVANPSGLTQIKDYCEFNNLKSPIVCQIKASEDIALERLLHRNDNPKEAERRVKADNYDFKEIDRYVDFSFRSDLGNMTPSVLAEEIMATYLLYTSQEISKLEKVISHLDSMAYELTEGF